MLIPLTILSVQRHLASSPVKNDTFTYTNIGSKSDRTKNFIVDHKLAGHQGVPMGSHERPRDYWVGELRAQLGQGSRKAEEDPLVREHIVAVAQAPHRTYPHQGKARGCSSARTSPLLIRV